MDERAGALVELGRELVASGYAFVTVTPETHRRRLANDAARGRVEATTVRDVLGWSKPFTPETMPDTMLALMRRAGVVVQADDGWLRATVRASTCGGDLFFHSAYPTTAPDSVFFGPDTYRYAALLRAVARGLGPASSERHVVDVGCGAGPGGVVALRSGLGTYATLVDVNDAALWLAEVNATIAGVDVGVMTLKSDVLSALTDPIDIVVSNPPYLKDPGARTYRDGGGTFGEALAVRIVRESLARVRSGGLVVVYTGVAIVEGEDVFLREIEPLCRDAGARLTYGEIDPDVFGEELELAAYASCDRIAAVGLRIDVP